MNEGPISPQSATIAASRGRPRRSAVVDDDCAPWLAAIARRIDVWRAARTLGMITCSALQRRYRDAIVRDRNDVCLAYLEGSAAVIANRPVAAIIHEIVTALSPQPASMTVPA